MPSWNTYHLTWVSLILGMGYLFTAASAKVQPLLLTLDEGYLLTATLPDLECGVAPLGPPAPKQPPLLATGDQWRNNSRKNEGMEPKQKTIPSCGCHC